MELALGLGLGFVTGWVVAFVQESAYRKQLVLELESQLQSLKESQVRKNPTRKSK